MRRMLTPLLMILTALALALPAGSTRAAERGVAFAALLPDTENWFEYGPTQGGDYGQAVASAGDVNGDGYADVIVGSPVYEESGDKIGAAFIYRGSISGVDSETNVVTLTSKKGSYFGYAVSGAGDVNGDGYDDVVIGAPHHHVALGYEGAAYVYHGSAGGLSTTPAWSKIGSDYAEFGCSVAGAGDVNNDGYDDVLVGACNYIYNDLEGAGAVYLFLGSASGLNPAAEPFSDWSFTGSDTGDILGFAVAGVGDINNDGCADFAVGAPGFDVNNTDRVSAGLVHVWYGVQGGVPGQAPTWTAYGNQYIEQFGYAVDGAGDIDANNFVDIIIGSRRYNDGSETVGGAYLFTTNIDGNISPTPRWIDSGPNFNSGYGMSVAGLGDLNNDGYADVGVGAPYCDAEDTTNNEGCVYVYRGSRLSLSMNETWLGRGGKSETEFGMSISGAGDVNGDGYDDLIVGAPIFKWDDKTPFGKSAVFHGALTDDIPNYWFYLPVVTK